MSGMWEKILNSPPVQSDAANRPERERPMAEGMTCTSKWRLVYVCDECGHIQVDVNDNICESCGSMGELIPNVGRKNNLNWELKE